MVFEKSSGATIHLQNTPNAHELYLGKSGSGKTWAICRRIEELYSFGKKILIVDYSGSYTIEELKKSGLSTEYLQVIDFTSQKVTFPIMDGSEADADRIVSLGDNVLGINGSLQKKILFDVAAEVCKGTNASFGEIQAVLEKRRENAIDNEDREYADRVEKVMDRWQLLAEQEKINVWNTDGMVPDSGKIVILQMSKLPANQRKIYMNTVLWILWQLLVQRESGFDVAVIDEAQHINFNAEIPSQIMRVGRKWGIGLLLSTQFLAGLDKESVSTILQAANTFYFQPDTSNIKWTASQIEPERPYEWLPILRNLEVGEAVLCGEYTINQNRNPVKKPKLIIVKIKRRYKNARYIY